MSRISTVIVSAFLLLGIAGWPVWAQEDDDAKPVSAKAEEKAAKPDAKPEARAERSGRSTTNLRVQLVISRYRDDKRTASLPYTFNITPGGARVRMRMGVETPVPIGGAGNPRVSRDSPRASPTRASVPTSTATHES